MSFEIVGVVENSETIAQGKGIRERARLVRIYGRGKWRKRKGVADLRLDTVDLVRAEIHW
jgi:hypothetical protein